MKTNHSQIAAFLVFSWMIFLSFFSNKKNDQPLEAPKSISIDSTHKHLTYESGEVLFLVNKIKNAEQFPLEIKK